MVAGGGLAEFAPAGSCIELPTEAPRCVEQRLWSQSTGMFLVGRYQCNPTDKAIVYYLEIFKGCFQVQTALESRERQGRRDSMDAQSTKRDSIPQSVAVVMATFNRAHFISEAIESILNQSRPPDEFIIVNDGSTDNTARVVRAFGNRVRYIEQSNGGKPAALNLALPQVQSTHVWIFDDDDIALPNALESHLKFLADHPQYDFSYSPNYVFAGRFSADLLERSRLKTFPPIADDRYFLWLMESPFLPSLQPGMLIPTRCYREVGPFDLQLLRGQDCDMVLRIARRFRGGLLPQPTFAERLHGGQRGPGFDLHAEADRYRVWRKYKKQIFRKLRASLSLVEYLPAGSLQPRSLDALETRHALLQRATIMAIHGLHTEAAADFCDYAIQFDATGSPLADNERKQISKLTDAIDPEMIPPGEYYRRLGTSCSQSELFKAAFRGLYWSISRGVSHHHPVVVSRLLHRTAILASARYGARRVGRVVPS